MSYSILFVDDEENVRKSIIKKIEWQKLGFEVIADAENGESALSKLEYLDVDIIITDIKMPFMDGIELARRAKNMRSSIEIVFFSGFNEFEYAKQAINIGVTEYILKPVDVDELTEILLKLKDKLDKKIEEKRNTEVLRNKYNESLPIMRDHFLHQLINGKLSEKEINKGLINYEIEIQNGYRWMTISLIIKTPNETRNDLKNLHSASELIPISVLQLLDDSLDGYVFNSFKSTIGINAIIAIDNIYATELVNKLNNLCRDCKRILDLTVTIGIGKPTTSIINIYESFLQSKDALGYREIMGAGSAIYINDVEPLKNKTLEFDEYLEGELLSAIKFAGAKDIEVVIGKIIENIVSSNVHTIQRQGYIISILDSLLKTMRKYEINPQEGYDYFNEINNLMTSDDIYKWLMDICLYINENIDKDRNNNNKNIVHSAKQYIIENFQNPDLNVDMVCNHLHLSEAYFSTVFKKETGTSYINYLTELRMTRAVELLNKSDDKIHIIASECGYQGSNYFSYVFKKYHGISPSSYRNS